MFNPIILASRYTTMLMEMDNKELERQLLESRDSGTGGHYSTGQHSSTSGFSEDDWWPSAPSTGDESFVPDGARIPNTGECKKLMQKIEQTIYQEIVEGYETFATWCHIIEPLEQTALHTHVIPGDRTPQLSWVYYVRTRPNCGNLNFQTTVHDRVIYMEEEAVEGKLVIFPSWMPHATGKNMSGETRISISGNSIGEFKDPKQLYNVIGITG